MRRKTREKVLQTLYMCDVLDLSFEEGGKLFLENFDGELDEGYFFSTLRGIEKHRQDIDNRISKCVRNWKFERISLVDRNILRIGTYELFYSEEVIPHPIVINEAVELAKKFGTDESGGFVNGVLDAMRREDISIYGGEK
ncbi:MAG: transcription antitermination factor NusB [Deltaproteobacteria bacterium]|nr:MAG: transcription antitermination factor NusB [Deltaproteobacteria bacterium]